MPDEPIAPALDVPIEPVPPTYSWVVRRRTMFVVLFFCMVVISYILWNRVDGNVAQTIVTGAFTVIGAVLMNYVFVASYEDIKRGGFFK